MRADRLLSLMLLLRARGRTTAQDLARHLEVSERTIYRDLDALSTAGIPVYAQPGTNGGVFLDENYRITLTGLSSAELQSLFLTSNAKPLGDLGLDKAVEDSLLKLFAALPSSHRSEVERLQQRFYIDPTNWFQWVEPSPFLPLLQQAVWEDRRVEIVYQVVEGETSNRIVDAYGLVAKVNIWYLVARNRKGDMRYYRLARLRDMKLTDEHFKRQTDFDLATFWKVTCETFERDSLYASPPYEALVRVHPKGFSYFPSWMNGHYEQIGEADSEGWVKLRTSFESIEVARMRLLGLGTYIEVLEPAELRQTIIETAQAVVAFHAEKQKGKDHR
jgi:predicted DNA-binding transcriptional regulator YafY